MKRNAEKDIDERVDMLRYAVQRITLGSGLPDATEAAEQKLYSFYPHIRMRYDGMGPEPPYQPLARRFVNRTDVTRQISASRRVIHWLGLLHERGLSVELEVYTKLVMDRIRHAKTEELDELEAVVTFGRAKSPWPNEMSV